ncbi:MAG: DMT family transporter [Ilumatobacteraceae bacterium]
MVAGVLSVVAAAFYTLGLALQQQGNLVAGPVVGSGRIATARRVVLQPIWLAGFVVTGVGFVLHGTALSLGSLTTVQVLQTSQIVSMVPLSARVARVPVQARDWAGAAMVGTGLVLLLVALRPSEDTGEGSAGGWAVTAAAAVVFVAAVGALARARVGLRAPLFGLAAGCVFGIEGATLKLASDDLAEHFTAVRILAPAMLATLVLAVVGVVLQNLALRAGRLAVAMSTMTIAMPVTSTVIGVGVFGEHLELTPLTVVVGVAAAVLAACGVVLLSQATALAPGRPVVAAAPAA